MTEFAPIAVFAFNRPIHLRRTLEALAANSEAKRSHLTIFCDGPRNQRDGPAVAAVHNVARERCWCGEVEVHVAETNRGLADAIVQGVTDLCAAAGRVIVLEDDLLVSRHFLRFLNDGLARYESSAEVMQVAGHCFPAAGFERSSGCSFLPFTTSLGWGTWDRAWRQFDHEMHGCERLEVDAALRRRFELDGAYPYMRLLRRLRRSGELHQSWGIRWHWTVLKAGGLVLYPHRTLVFHTGDDGSGTNVRGRHPPVDIQFSFANCVEQWPSTTAVDERFYTAVRIYRASQQSLLNRGKRFLRRFLPRS